MYNELEELRGYGKRVVRIKESKLPDHVVRSKWKDSRTGKVYDSKLSLLEDLDISMGVYTTLINCGIVYKIDYTLIGKNKKREVGYIDCTCERCGKEFTKLLSQIRGSRMYCSRLCYYNERKNNN